MILSMSNIPKNTSVKHGTNTMYTAYGCRCEACLKAGRQQCNDYYKGLSETTKKQRAKRLRQSVAKRKTAIREYLNALKSKPCSDCENVFPSICMDFDHVRGEKLFCVSFASTRAFPLWKIKKEVEKCDLVCSNCHRVRTLERSTP